MGIAYSDPAELDPEIAEQAGEKHPKDYRAEAGRASSTARLTSAASAPPNATIAPLSAISAGSPPPR